MPTKASARMTATMVALVLLTVVLRLVVIAVDGDRLHSDPDAYVQLATTLSDHCTLSSSEDLRPTAFRPVLYPFILAAPLSLGLPAPIAVAAINIIAAVILVLTVVGLARECGLPPGAGMLAGLFVSVDPLLNRYVTEPMTENVCAALVTGAMLYLLKYVGVLKKSDSPRTILAGAVAGVLLGLSALCRPIILLSCVLLTLVLLILMWRQSRTSASWSLTRQLTLALFPAAVAAVVVSPWIIRNAIHFNALVPATTHGGYTLLLGNNAEFYDRVVSGSQSVWDGPSLTQWQCKLQGEMVRDGVDQSDERAIDQWMYQRAIEEIRSRPTDAVWAVVLRWRRFWAITPASTDTLPKVAYRVVAAWYCLIGFGLLSSLLRLRVDHRILLLWISILSFLAVHSFYWTNARMRAPLTGVIIVLSVCGWCFLVNRQPSTAAACDTDE